MTGQDTQSGPQPPMPVVISPDDELPDKRAGQAWSAFTHFPAKIYSGVQKLTRLGSISACTVCKVLGKKVEREQIERLV